MRKKQTWIAALLALVLLLSAGCGKSPDSIKDNIVVPTEATAPVTDPPRELASDASLTSLRRFVLIFKCVINRKNRVINNNHLFI